MRKLASANVIANKNPEKILIIRESDFVLTLNLGLVENFNICSQ